MGLLNINKDWDFDKVCSEVENNYNYVKEILKHYLDTRETVPPRILRNFLEAQTYMEELRRLEHLMTRHGEEWLKGFLIQAALDPPLTYADTFSTEKSQMVKEFYSRIIRGSLG